MTRGVTKRVIPCLDVDQGWVVKGVNFIDIRDAGDLVEVASRHDEQKADGINFLDITASSDQRETVVGMVWAVAGEDFIPLTVGGGIREFADIHRMLQAGADKVSINAMVNIEIRYDQPDLGRMVPMVFAKGVIIQLSGCGLIAGMGESD